MKRLAELLADNKQKHQSKARSKRLRKIQKSRIRIAKFSKRKGCFVVMTNHTKCQNEGCGAISGLSRLGCPVCGGMNVVWGTLINTGKIEKSRFKCAVQQSEFITNNELHKRMISGERFLEAGTSKPEELSLSNFDLPGPESALG